MAAVEEAAAEEEKAATAGEAASAGKAAAASEAAVASSTRAVGAFCLAEAFAFLDLDPAGLPGWRAVFARGASGAVVTLLPRAPCSRPEAPSATSAALGAWTTSTRSA